MKTLPLGMVAAALILGLGGCTKESNTGGPGAKNNTDKSVERSYRTPDNKVPDSKETFTLSVPRTETNVHQGDRDVATIAINRGKDFEEPVTVRLKAPQGLVITPSEFTMKPGDKEMKVTIEAKDDAAVGKTNIEVMGQPATGKPVSVQLPIEVKERR